MFCSLPQFCTFRKLQAERHPPGKEQVPFVWGEQGSRGGEEVQPPPCTPSPSRTPVSDEMRCVDGRQSMHACCTEKRLASWQIKRGAWMEGWRFLMLPN